MARTPPLTAAGAAGLPDAPLPRLRAQASTTGRRSDGRGDARSLVGGRGRVGTAPVATVEHACSEVGGTVRPRSPRALRLNGRCTETRMSTQKQLQTQTRRDWTRRGGPGTGTYRISANARCRSRAETGFRSVACMAKFGRLRGGGAAGLPAAVPPEEEQEHEGGEREDDGGADAT